MRKPEVDEKRVETCMEPNARARKVEKFWCWCHSVRGNKILHIIKVAVLYPFSILSRCARGSGGSRFTLQQQNTEIQQEGTSKHTYTYANFPSCHKTTHSVSFFTRKSSQTIEASVSLRRRGRIALVRASRMHIYSE